MPISQTQQTLVASNLTFFRGNTAILRGIDLTLQVGDVLGLTGLNGAGKSTTLACLAGHLAPDAGQVHVAGCDLVAHPATARRHIGYLPDPPALFNEFRVDRHLNAMATLYGLPRTDHAAAVERVIALCDLGAVLRKRIAHLSQGYRQRVGLAQALLHRPALLLLDEPTNGLDIGQQQAFAQTIREVARHTAVVISSHHLSDVRASCNRIASLEDGVLTEHKTGTDPNTTDTVFIRLVQAVDHSELCSLPMVADAVPERDGWKITVLGGTAHFSDCIADRGWGLQQLSPMLFETPKPPAAPGPEASSAEHIPEVTS